MMKAMITVQRILATLAAMYGFCLTLSEADITADILGMLEPLLFGLALIAVSVGWLLLTGLEEDWFINRSKRR